MTSYLDIDWLRKQEAEPHWFGLGFIQLKLTPTLRMHFWHPQLVADVGCEEVHDHRYSFKSEVLLGSVSNLIFDFHPNHEGETERVAVSCDPLKPSPKGPNAKGTLTLTGRFKTAAGDHYWLDQDTFHQTVATRAVTKLLRPEVATKPYAHVLRPLGAASVCPFSNPKPAAQLWELIADVLEPTEEKPGYHVTQIAKGSLGEASKIREECAEFMDAVSQDVSVMALVELSDLIGATEAYLNKHHPSISLDDLKKMSAVTKRAFDNGSR